MAAIGRGRSLKNLRIRGKPACRPRSPHPVFAVRRGARLCPGTGVGEANRASGAAGLRWFLTGVVCLFRTGRNDSGEENVPLDLTRGNAGHRGRRAPGLGRAGTRPAGQRGAEPAPIPLPRAGFPPGEPLRASGGCGSAGARGRPRCTQGPGAARTPAGACLPPPPVRSRVPESRRRPRTRGGRGCYLGYWRMFVGRATTSCPPRSPEQMLDLPASC